MKRYQSRATLGILGTSLDQMFFSAAKLANSWLMQESRASAGYPFSMSRCLSISFRFHFHRQETTFVSNFGANCLLLPSPNPTTFLVSTLASKNLILSLHHHNLSPFLHLSFVGALLSTEGLSTTLRTKTQETKFFLYFRKISLFCMSKTERYQ